MADHTHDMEQGLDMFLPMPSPPNCLGFMPAVGGLAAGRNEQAAMVAQQPMYLKLAHKNGLYHPLPRYALN